MSGLPIIMAIVYTINQLILKATAENKKFQRFVPLISAGLGGVLGVLIYIIEPASISAMSIFKALEIGISAGLGATGTSAILYQMKNENKALSQVTEVIEQVKK